MSTKLTQEQHQKAVHLLAERLTLNASIETLSAHYYQAQVSLLDMLTPTALQYVLEDTGYQLEDLK